MTKPKKPIQDRPVHKIIQTLALAACDLEHKQIHDGGPDGNIAYCPGCEIDRAIEELRKIFPSKD